MKKIVCFLMLLSVIASTVCVVYADGHRLVTGEEYYEICSFILDGEQFNNIVRDGQSDRCFDDPVPKEIKYENRIIANSYTVFEVDGLGYYKSQYFKSMDEIVDGYKLYFTNDLCDIFMKHLTEHRSVSSVYGHPVGHFEGLEYYPSNIEIDSVLYRICENDQIGGNHILEFDDITATEDKYVVNIKYLIPFSWDYTNETIEVTRIDGNLKMSGGTYFERRYGGGVIDADDPRRNELTYEEYKSMVQRFRQTYGNQKSPNTGDETAILTALLALSGIAVAVVPKVKKRKI